MNTYGEALKTELENNYLQFLNALKIGKETVIKEAMSSYSYAANKNVYADAKEPFASKMMEIGKTYPVPSDLDFIKLFKKGPTAALLYSRDSESSNVFNRPMLTFIFIKFVHENTKWKTDTVELIDIEKYNSDGSLTMFDISYLSKESHVDGKIKEAPPLIPEAEVPGILEVFVNGLTATIFINTINQGTVHEISDLKLVHGGLKFGQNTIEIMCEDMKSDNEKSITVSIQAKRKNNVSEMFRYEAKHNIPRRYVANFNVLKVTLHKTTKGT